jgi:hypothetical protein
MFSWPPAMMMFGVAGLDGLRRQVGGLQAAAAHVVDGEAWNSVRQAGLDDSLARRILADAGGQHLAEDGFADQVGSMPVLASRPLITCAPSSDAGNFGQAAAEFADACTASGHDNYIIHVILQCAGRSRLSLATTRTSIIRSSAQAVQGFDCASPRETCPGHARFV